MAESQQKQGPRRIATALLWRQVSVAVAIVSTSLITGCGHDSDSTSSTATTSTTTTTTTTTTTPKLPPQAYTCTGDAIGVKLVQTERKGLAVDDTTFEGCSNKMPMLWPGTYERVRSLRIFTPWRPEWGDDSKRYSVWHNLIEFVNANEATVLVGQDVTCDEKADDKEWEWNLELLKMLGHEHVHGVAIGNEMDIYYQKPGATPSCINKLWNNGGYLDTFISRVNDLDANGFSQVPLTSVWAGSVLGGWPFINTSTARVLDFVEQVYHRYSSRWVWAATIYAIWDTNVLPAPCDHCKQCEDLIGVVTDMGDYNGNLVKAYRQRIQAVTGKGDDPFWVAETGWSSPSPAGLGAHCDDYTSLNTFKEYYANFLSWNLSYVQPGVVGPSHIFYFTMRDSSNFGAAEHFGLIGTCADTECKLGHLDRLANSTHHDAGHVQVGNGRSWSSAGILNVGQRAPTGPIVG